ncbi:MAG: HD domain-containing protein [Candidatus Woesearchaeota archaeon]
MDKDIKKIYDEVYNLFPKEGDERKDMYKKRSWIFPHHINIMLEMAEKLCEKYQGNLRICQLAIILHDTGLVYNRSSDSSKGHEENSLKFAKIILTKYSLEMDEILECIKATEVNFVPKTINQKIVRTVDALSQFKSIHFIAKATFSGNFDNYLPWLRFKINKGFEKICFEDEKKEVEFIKKYFDEALRMYDFMQQTKIE